MMEGQALTATSRSGDPDFPGVVRQVSDGWRVAVNPDGTRYQLQKLAATHAGDAWVPIRSYASLSALLSAQASKVEGLAVACKGLPAIPAKASPKLKSARAEIKAAYTATDWRRNDYGRNIRRDGNIRLVVDPACAEYRLQWITSGEHRAGGSDNWRTIRKSAYLSDLLSHLFESAYLSDDRENREALQVRASALCDGFPEWVGDGLWPALPERP